MSDEDRKFLLVNYQDYNQVMRTELKNLVDIPNCNTGNISNVLILKLIKQFYIRIFVKVIKPSSRIT